ncbi:hypothetical protein [Virgisporangium aurantiacum]|uniref:Uncharacterized protein n=1 Tax=Virgisporangium aurantiacum TaxID=175570 RepID=A0A8J3ZFZ3_9ACTN|nr:hypothetical protein [Virgisporangium aurantiacum]GIJ62182.1 hypothetical protein Vau01_096980 [Virgisporangium aurantiacum]
MTDIPDRLGGRQHGRMGSITNRVIGKFVAPRPDPAGVSSVEREYQRQPFRVTRRRGAYRHIVRSGALNTEGYGRR